MRFSSFMRTTARISMPTVNRSFGWSMRETEMASMGSRETIPQPISANAPNGSKCVMRTGITSPQVSPAMYSAMQRSCAFRRDNTAVILPNASRIKSVMIKHTGLFTREMMAMSRTVPSRMPERALFARDNAPHTLEIYNEVVLVVADDTGAPLRSFRRALRRRGRQASAYWLCFSALSIK